MWEHLNFECCWISSWCFCLKKKNTEKHPTTPQNWLACARGVCIEITSVWPGGDCWGRTPWQVVSAQSVVNKSTKWKTHRCSSDTKGTFAGDFYGQLKKDIKVHEVFTGASRLIRKSNTKWESFELTRNWDCPYSEKTGSTCFKNCRYIYIFCFVLGWEQCYVSLKGSTHHFLCMAVTIFFVCELEPFDSAFKLQTGVSFKSSSCFKWRFGDKYSAARTIRNGLLWCPAHSNKNSKHILSPPCKKGPAEFHTPHIVKNQLEKRTHPEKERTTVHATLLPLYCWVTHGALKGPF